MHLQTRHCSFHVCICDPNFSANLVKEALETSELWAVDKKCRLEEKLKGRDVD